LKRASKRKKRKKVDKEKKIDWRREETNFSRSWKGQKKEQGWKRDGKKS
jgi:hypothetical protein